MKFAYLAIVFLVGMTHMPNSFTSALPSTPAVATNPAGSAQPQKLERRMFAAIAAAIAAARGGAALMRGQ
ncbi:hypothetical protein IWQ62_001775, partial [Dispira parvispora]